MSETKPLNLFQRIIKVRQQVGYAQKDKSVSTGGGSYKAVTHDQVTAIVREHMNAFGIVCVPTLVKSVMNPKEDGAKQQRYDATYSFDFVNADDPTDRLTIVIESHAMDNADKAPGKALSYAKKYALLKLFEIETGEDEESRYQDQSIDVVPMLQQINGAKTLDELKMVFAAAHEFAKGDRDALRQVIASKDAKKKALTEQAAAAQGALQ